MCIARKSNPLSVGIRSHSSLSYFVSRDPGRIISSINPLAAIPAKTNECQGSAVFRQRKDNAAKLPLPLPLADLRSP